MSDPEKHSHSSSSSSSQPTIENTEHIQKIVQEGILLGGGAAAILLQVANPGVGKGVNTHSNFSYRPMDRLRTTMTFVYCMAFGSPRERAAIVEAVHRAHAPVQGKDYSADDSGLQVWVAATLYAVGIEIYEEMFGEISDEKLAEQIYREYGVLAVSLRVKPEEWPASRAEFWAYWDAQIEGMQVNEDARAVARDLLYEAKLPVHFRVLMPWVRLVTAELLPPRIREAYGLKSSKARRRGYWLTRELMRNTYCILPKALRTYPKKYYLKDMRKRLRTAGLL